MKIRKALRWRKAHGNKKPENKKREKRKKVLENWKMEKVSSSEKMNQFAHPTTQKQF